MSGVSRLHTAFRVLVTTISSVRPTVVIYIHPWVLCVRVILVRARLFSRLFHPNAFCTAPLSSCAGHLAPIFSTLLFSWYERFVGNRSRAQKNNSLRRRAHTYYTKQATPRWQRRSEYCGEKGLLAVGKVLGGERAGWREEKKNFPGSKKTRG